MQYTKLFEPISIKGMELRNRIIMPAMHLNHVSEGRVTPRLVRFYEERARGGAGLIIVGGCIINQWAGGLNMIALHQDFYIPGLKELTLACKKHGTKIGAQLYMAGAYAHSFFIKRQALTSSTHVSRFTREEAKGMTKEEIQMVIADFASAAARAREAGFDMVEILGSAGYLICQFLSPLINKREDEYGGSLENRMRFGLEVIAAVRRAVGDDFCVGIRLAGNDFVPGSHTNQEARIFARACQEAGVDLINVTGGWHETRVPQITSDLPRGGFAYLARGIREVVEVPVAASNRFSRPREAEEALEEGFADLVCLGRPLIADPEFPRKAWQGLSDEIRPCIACNQKCFDHVFQLKPVGCLVNVLAGEEYRLEIKPSASPRKVLVIGGGAAGCEAALRAAQRGHRVTLYEKEPRLGGQVAWWHLPVEKQDFYQMFRYYHTALTKAGVELHLGEEFTVEQAQGADYDRIWVATGAQPLRPDLPGVDLPHVVQAWDVLQGKARTGRRVVVVGGGAVGLETSIFLAKKGTLTPQQLYFLMLHQAETPEVLRELMLRGSKEVTVVEMLPKLGRDMGPSTRWVALKKLNLFGVKTHVKTKVLSIQSHGVVCQGPEGQEMELEADSVVLAVGARPLDSLAQELEKIMPGRVQVLGDAREPQNAARAVEEGFKAAMELD